MTNAATTTYTATISPTFDGLTPQFELVIIRDVRAGISGPFSDPETFPTLEAAIAQLRSDGFELVGPFGEVCGNGFATAPLALIPDPPFVPTTKVWSRR